MNLATRIAAGRGDFVLFAVTPPRQSTPADQLPGIARATVERLQGLELDGLVLYDIDDESSRNPDECPFPFSQTVDPSDYRSGHLQGWPTPVIVYRAVGKYGREELGTWLSGQDPRSTLTVMVGAASSGTAAPLSLADAQAMRLERNPDLLRWLGVDVPRWIENDLRHSTNPLQASLDQALATGVEIIDFCRRLGVPCGLNIESVSIRREEIEAAVELAARLSKYLRAG